MEENKKVSKSTLIFIKEHYKMLRKNKDDEKLIKEVNETFEEYKRNIKES